MGLGRLQELFLSGNKLTKFYSGAFSKLEALKELNLEFNEFGEFLQADSRMIFTKLQLCYSAISHIPKQFFYYMGELKILTLKEIK